MDERNEMEKMNDDTMLPGFRFHPTDEELVDFYLRRKIQQKSLPIELIKQVDIYKYDPWELPKLASTGEKEWYFYCPRDRKYRNSPRPNRVTRAGFWKATGTDRPIYSSSEGKCIGLKKSLVFYRGRAAKGIKTDWMMHEFRLPSPPPPDSSPSSKKPFDDDDNNNNNKTHSTPQDSLAICRIFKKTNSMSMAQKALSHNWMAHQFPEESISVSDMLAHSASRNNIHLSSENMSCTTELYEQVSSGNFSGSDHVGFNKATSQMPVVSHGGVVVADTFMFSTFESSGPCAYIGFEGPNNNMINNGVSVPHHHEDLQALNMAASTVAEAIGFPFSLPPPVSNDAWKPNLLWESSPPCPNDMSTNNRCST